MPTASKQMQEDAQNCVGNMNTTMYHPTIAPSGKEVTYEEAKSMGEGWVDTPAKFGKPVAKKADTPVDPVTVAEDLLSNDGLTLTSFVRGMGKNPNNNSDRKRLKAMFDGLIEGYGDSIDVIKNIWYWVK